MKQNRSKRHVKGFTLIELIIVLAIIGVLLGILLPAMASYFRRSRIQAANMNAKMVYNAAQTAVQKMISTDRTASAANASGFDGVVRISHSDDGTLDCVTGANTFPSNDGTRANVAACSRIEMAVNRTVSDASEISWAILIDNYIVKGAVAADNDTATHVGFFSTSRQVATMETPRAPYNTSFETTLTTLASGYDAAT